MSPARRRFLFLFFFLLSSTFLVGSIYLYYRGNPGSITYFHPAEDDPKQTIKLERMGGDWFLVDRTLPYREQNNRRILNPFNLTEGQLRSIARERWELDNPWIAFQNLYVSYYDVFYSERFGQDLTKDDPELRSAYERWKHEQSP